MAQLLSVCLEASPAPSYQAATRAGLSTAEEAALTLLSILNYSDDR